MIAFGDWVLKRVGCCCCLADVSRSSIRCGWIQQRIEEGQTPQPTWSAQDRCKPLFVKTTKTGCPATALAFLWSLILQVKRALPTVWARSAVICYQRARRGEDAVPNWTNEGMIKKGTYRSSVGKLPQPPATLRDPGHRRPPCHQEEGQENLKPTEEIGSKSKR